MTRLSTMDKAVTATTKFIYYHMKGFCETCTHTPDCSYYNLEYDVCDGTGCEDYEVCDTDMT